MNQGTILGSQIGRWIVLAALVAVLGALLLAIQPVRAQDSTTIEYAENSTDAVVTLSADDPEDATPITWSLVEDLPSPVPMVGGAPLVAADFADFGVFKISQSGVLEFKSPPNHEASATINGVANTYRVVVQATDGDAGPPIGPDNLSRSDTRSWFKVIVNVRDVEEPETVRLHPGADPAAETSAPVTLLQPQVGVPVSVTVTGGDGSVTDESYQWYRAPSMTSDGTMIPNASGPDAISYIPVHEADGASDIGQHLRVVVSYNDARGGGKKGETVSLYPTIGSVLDNESPTFRDSAPTTRGVRENAGKGTNISHPVSATDPESKLTYWLSGGTDPEQGTENTAAETTDDSANAMFSIDADTGQLKVKSREELDRETAPNGYAVTVNVADSSPNDISAGRAAIIVLIRVLQEDEAPKFAVADDNGGNGDGSPPTTIEHVEVHGGTVLDTNLSDNYTDGVLKDTVPVGAAVYSAYDPEGGTVTLSLAGPDKDIFRLVDDVTDTCPGDRPSGVVATAPATCETLAFKEKPDFEDPMDSNKDNVYEVTVQASDSANTSTKDVTVKVTNLQEDGKVKVTPEQARIGVELTAALTDSDIVAYGPMWQWQRRNIAAPCDTPVDAITDTDDDWMRIRDANSDTYTAHPLDLGYCLRAVATYNDGYHEGTAETTGIYVDFSIRFDKTAEKILSKVQYPSNNLAPRFGSATTKRFVPEGIAANNPVGTPVTATDPNGAEDLAGYSLSGTDQDSFDIDAYTGQLKTGMKFNHETKDKYTVTVTAKDTHDATAKIRVDIYVVDVDEMPQGTGTTKAENTIEYAENSTDAVVTLSAGDPEGATPITWSLLVEDLPSPVPMVGGAPLVAADFADQASFKIDLHSGKLEFKSPPDHEASATINGVANTYRVVVQATDGDAGPPIGPDNLSRSDTRSWFKVIVNVGREDEPETVRLHPGADPAAETSAPVTLLQPQVGVPVSVTVTGGDGSVTDESYQWYRAPSMTSDGTMIPNASGPDAISYIPVHEADGASDIGQHLRVVVSYTDADGVGKRDETVSLYPTIGNVLDNESPTFRDSAPTTRGVRENAERDTEIIGRVSATDPESKLTYWLSGGTDPEQGTENTAAETTDDSANAMFSIDADTGQLKVKSREELDRETAPNGYAVTVNVADSSPNDISAGRAAIIVLIRVLQEDEAPKFAVADENGDGDESPPTTIEHVEGHGGTDGTVLDRDLSNNYDTTSGELADSVTVEAAVYTAYDPEGGTVTLSLAGPDKDIFELGDATCPGDGARPSGVVATAPATCKTLAFKAKPDFEDPMDSNKDNVYEVTVQASDSANTSTKDVTVKVTNRQEDGEVKVMPEQARIGVELTAALTDSDIVAYGPMWQWQRRNITTPCDTADDPSVDTDNWMRIRGANSATYTTHAEDLNYCLRAVATYNDGFHEGAATAEIYVDPSIRFDKTAEMILSAVQYPSNNLAPRFGSRMTERFVPEGIAAKNPVGTPVTAFDPNGAEDLAGYSLSGTDQDSFDIDAHTGQLKTGMKFNHEMKDKYTVTVTAKDTHDATASIRVDIYVIDVDEMPPIMEGGLSISGSGGVNYMENGTDAVATYTAVGPDADMARWSLEGDDDSHFTISRGGELTFRNTPNYEMPRSDDGDNTYMVTVVAEDTMDNMASKDVTVTVTNVVELGMLTAEMDSSSSYMENGSMPVATYTAAGSMAGNARWTLMGDDARYFMLDGTTGMSSMLKFRNSPDYEMPRGMAMSDTNTNTYMVTVKASAGGEMDMVDVTVEVTNVEELGMLSGPDSVNDYRENGEGAVGTYMVASIPGAANPNWTLMGDDMGDLSISTSGVLTFDAPPDYEMPMDADTDNQYMVTVKAEAGGEMKMMPVTVTVTNEDEDGMVTLMPMRPSVGTEITATLTDPDMMVTGTTWQWSRSMTTDGTFTPITGVTSAMYTPAEADEDYYLKATASYTDAYGSGKSAMEMTESPVSLFAIDGPMSPSYVENGTAAVATYNASGDAAPTWTLEGDDAGDFTITGGMLRFMSSPNYEMPKDADTNNVYMVTVKASDGTNTDAEGSDRHGHQRGRGRDGYADADGSQRWHGNNRHPDRP